MISIFLSKQVSLVKSNHSLLYTSEKINKRYICILRYTKVLIINLLIMSDNNRECATNDARLDQEDVTRYSRQMILPEIGVPGQLALRQASVLVVGAGGLGCPAIQYLAAAGVGKIGIIDYDTVETSNLHRQILHTESGVKKSTRKTHSAAQAVKAINSKVTVEEFYMQLDRQNAVDTVKHYCVVIDATDNVVSRYLVNDACVLANKPLVSGSALRWEGQLTVYNYQTQHGDCKGPCYRCLYPSPPPPETVTNCSDGGVLGVVPGIIGCFQALEAIKIIVGVEPSYHQKLLVFDGLVGGVRTVKLRGAQPNCVVCGNKPSITKNTLPDYVKFCGSAATDKCVSVKLLDDEQRITAARYKNEFVDAGKPHVLLDVREPVELQICSLPNSTNISIRKILFCKSKLPLAKSDEERSSACRQLLEKLFTALDNVRQNMDRDEPTPVVVVCRLGNDSQKAVDFLNREVTFHESVTIKDISGGLTSWAKTVDKQFFTY